MNKKGVGVLIWLLILTVVTVGFAVQTNPNFDVDRFKENLEWDGIEFNVTEAPELGEALEDLTNGVGSAFFGLVRWASDLAKDNPTVPWTLILIAVTLAILAPILIVTIKVGAIIFILTREYFQSRKEKMILKEKGGVV